MENNPSNGMFSSRPGIGVVHRPSPRIREQVPDANKKFPFERPRIGVVHRPSPRIRAQVPDSNKKFLFERPRIGVVHRPSPSIGVQVPTEEKRETAEIDGSSEMAIGKRQTIEVGPWGGSGSNSWDDGSYTGIRGIGISHGDAIGTLRVVYDLNGETFNGPKHKSRSDYTYNDKIELQFPEEFIVSVNGHTSPLPRLSTETLVVRSLTFKTNKRTFGPYGAEEGTPFNFPIKNGFIVGFQGRSNGQVLNAIGFHLSL